MSQPAQPRPAIGPILGATVITDSLRRVLPAYAAIGLTPVDPAPWGQLEIEGSSEHRSVWLAAAGAEPWLRLLELPQAPVAARYGRPGWFALEVATNDVHRLAETVLAAPGFEHLGGPAPLAVSEHIVAMQVAGPCGELYYFTEVRRELPPFDLHQPRRLLDRLFIAVATVRSRADSMAFWSDWSGVPGLAFDTRVSVLNRGLGLAADHPLPIATMQLAEGALVEIDQLPPDRILPATAATDFAQGIAQISVAGLQTGWLRGPDEELIQILGQDS